MTFALGAGSLPLVLFGNITRPPAPSSAPAPPPPSAPPTSASSAQSTYQAPPVLPPAIHTPAQARIAAQYKASALRDVADPRTLKVINDEVAKRDPKATPITPTEAKKLINDADVRVLDAGDYRTIKTALSDEGVRTNPAAAADHTLRATLPTDGVDRLATSRAVDARGKGATPTPAEITQARTDLQRIDPGAFKTPVKDAVYVNEAQASVPISDPTKTKVADHEFTHVLLGSRGITGPGDPQHRIIGALGWNQHPYAESANYGTPPGQGLP